MSFQIAFPHILCGLIWSRSSDKSNTKKRQQGLHLELSLQDKLEYGVSNNTNTSYYDEMTMKTKQMMENNEKKNLKKNYNNIRVHDDDDDETHS